MEINSTITTKSLKSLNPVPLPNNILRLKNNHIESLFFKSSALATVDSFRWVHRYLLVKQMRMI